MLCPAHRIHLGHSHACRPSASIHTSACWCSGVSPAKPRALPTRFTGATAMPAGHQCQYTHRHAMLRCVPC